VTSLARVERLTRIDCRGNVVAVGDHEPSAAADTVNRLGVKP
jgi:hypothetical protein